MNRLQNEVSPYLLQHSENPVDWWAWGDEPFEYAAQHELPIFLSVGYSTCYWCHVMEKDSFEHQEVADALRGRFVAIKLDREERPDIDQLYMDYVVALHGHGGWPLSVFLTPDRQPFWGGTFFYRAQFIQILNQLSATWRDEQEKIRKAASGYITISRSSGVGGAIESIRKINELAVSQYQRRFDREHGGFGGAPKFPQVETLMYLLSEREFRPLITLTLDKMAAYGLFDQIGGGFHRYCVDNAWQVPHFEKMLYDNGLLLTLYAEAYKIFGHQRYLEVVKMTADYLLRELQSEDGGFEAAQDAGLVASEGEYYVFTPNDVVKALGEAQAAVACSIFGISEHGNFEHNTSVLSFVNCDQRTLAEEFRPLLKAYRDKRERPHQDQKIIVSWNALAMTGLARAFQVTKESAYLEAAKRALSFIKRGLWDGERLARHSCAGTIRAAATLEDYALLIESAIELEDLEFAELLQSQQDKTLWDEQAGGYWFSSASDLLMQKKDWFDGALPSGNSSALLNLMNLHSLTGQKAYWERAETLALAYRGELSRYPTASAKGLRALKIFEMGPGMCVGDACRLFS